MTQPVSDVTATVYVGDDGAIGVQVDTADVVRHVRIWLNEAVLYDGDPEGEAGKATPTKNPGEIYLDPETGEFTGTAPE